LNPDSRFQKNKNTGVVIMLKQTNKTVIGVFVISAIAMLTVGVILLGGGEMFKEKQEYIMFFHGPVRGLSVGAPVNFSGVEIGSVRDIVLEYDTETLKIDVPVIIELYPRLYKVKGEEARSDKKLRQEIKKLIEAGLRAKLVPQSIVTGQMAIEMNLYPGTPVHLAGIKSEYIEIPTLPSTRDELVKKLAKLPIDKIAVKLLDVLNNIDNVVGGPEIKDILRNVDTASQHLEKLILDANKLVTNTDGRVKKISDNLVETTDDAQKLIKNADNQIQPVSNKAQDALVSAKEAMDQAKTALAGINAFVGEHSDTRHKLNQALDEIAAAARSLNSLADYLERHPEALIKGKGNGGG
jgi:paraquat-inducible protein B